MPIANGAVFAGYTIVRLLGTGGMGEVYLAQHPRLPKQEALKILPADVSANEEYRQRFAREADIAASLWHSHIVDIHDRGEYDGQLWIAMEYVEGTDAAQLMRQRFPRGMPPEEVVEIVSAVADALDYAHARYLLHRDVKPANILLTDPSRGDRRILLADFGIARDINDNNGLTATNMTLGTVLYAAPEQLTGNALDGRADQYALAVTAFHLLAGKPPFAHSNPAVVIGNHLSSAPPQLARLRAELAPIDSVLARAMAKEPFRRFDTCRDFATALARAVAGATSSSSWMSSTAPTQFATPIPVPQHDTARSQLPMIAAGIAALIAVGVVAFVGARLAQPSSAPSAAPYPSATPAPQTVTITSPAETSTTSSPPPSTSTTTRTTSSPVSRGGDLGLTTPISKPACNGQGIVVLGSVTTPGMYAEGVQRFLNMYPGSYYLRTDQTCPSLRQATDEGNPIYAVYVPAGFSDSAVCAKVRAVGGNAYGKWLNYTTDPAYIIPC